MQRKRKSLYTLKPQTKGKGVNKRENEVWGEGKLNIKKMERKMLLASRRNDIANLNSPPNIQSPQLKSELEQVQSFLTVKIEIKALQCFLVTQ